MDELDKELNNLNSGLDVDSGLDVNSNIETETPSVSEVDPDDLPSLEKTGNLNAGVGGKSYYKTNSFSFYNRVKKPKSEENLNKVSSSITKDFYGSSSLTERLKRNLTDPDGVVSNNLQNPTEQKVNVPFGQQSLLGNKASSVKRTEDIQKLYERMSYVKEKLDSFVGTGIDVSYKKGGTYGDQILGISVRIPGSGLSNFGRPQAFNFDVTNSGAVVESTTGRLMTAGVYSTSSVDKRLNSIDVAAGLVSSYIWSSTVDSKYGLVDKSFESMKNQLDYSAFNRVFGGLADGFLIGLRSSSDRQKVMFNFKQRLMEISLSDVDSSLEFNILTRNLTPQAKELTRRTLAEKSYLKLESAFSNVLNAPVGINRDALEQKLLTSFDRLNTLLTLNQTQEVSIDGNKYRVQALQSLKEQIISVSPSLQRNYKNLQSTQKKSTVDLLLSPFLMSHDLGYSQGQLYARTVLAKDIQEDKYDVLSGLKKELHADGKGLNFFDSARHKHGEAVTYSGSYVKGIGETATEGENYASFYATDKLFKSMSQLGYVSLTELKQQLSEAGVKDTDSVLNKFRSNYSEEEEEPTLLLLPFRKLQQMSQRLKNMLGTRAAFEISADLLQRAREQKSFTGDYYEEDSQNPDDLIYKLRADKFLTGNLPATLPNVQFQELQRTSAEVLAQMRVTKEELARDPAKKQEYDSQLIGALRRREFSPYQEIRGVIGGKQARRVLVNMGIGTMSDFSYLNKEYLDKSAFGYQHVAKFNLSKSKMTPYGIAEDNFLYQSQLAATQEAFNTKEERFIYHGREELKNQGGAAETLKTIEKIFYETANKYGVEAAKTSLIQQFDFLDSNSFKVKTVEVNEPGQLDSRVVLEAVNLKPGLYGYKDKQFAFFGALNRSQLELTEDFRYIGNIQYDSKDYKSFARRKRSIISIDVSAESRSQQRGITFIKRAPTYIDRGMKTEVQIDLNTSFDLTDGSRFGTPNIKNPVRVVEGDIFNEYDKSASDYKDLFYSPSSNMPIFGMFNTSAFKGYNFDAGAEIIRTKEGLEQIKSYKGSQKALALALTFMDTKDTSVLRQNVIDYLKENKIHKNLVILLEKGALGSKAGKLDNLLISAPGLAKLSTGEGETTRELIQSIQLKLSNAFKQGSDFSEINSLVNTILDNALVDGTEVKTNIDGRDYDLYTFDERSSKVRSAAIVADILSTTSQILNPVDTSKLSKNFFEYSLVDSSGKARVKDYIENKRFRDAVQDIAAKAGFKLNPVDKILGNVTEEENLANTLIQLNLFVNKPRLIQRAVNILPSYSLTTSGTDDAVKLEFQYLLSASKREMANLKGIGVDTDEMSAISTAFKIVSSYGNLDLAMSSGRSINVVSPFITNSNSSYEDQTFVDDFLRYYSPSLEKIKMFGSSEQQSMADRLIIDYVTGQTSDLSIDQYKNIIRTASDYLELKNNKADSTEGRLKATSELMHKFSGKSLNTFGCSLQVDDKKRQAITEIVSSFIEKNPFNLRNRLSNSSVQQEVITILESKDYKNLGISLSDITNAVNAVTDDLTGSVSLGDKNKIREKVFTSLYENDVVVIKGFENIKRESVADNYISGLHKIAATSKMLKESNDLSIREKGESLYNQVYNTQAIMTVDIAVEEPTATTPGVISIYDKNQLYSDRAPTNISYGSSSAVLFGLDVLQAIPVEFGNYTHQLLPEQIRLRELLPQYRAIVSKLTKGSIRNATFDEIKVLREFNDLSVRSQESLAGIGASILQQKVTGHAMRFPGASAIATASYLLGMDEVVAGGRFTGEDSSIASNYVRVTNRRNELREIKPNLLTYVNLKSPKSFQEFDSKLYQKLVSEGVTDTDIKNYYEIRNKIKSRSSTSLDLTETEFNLFNRVRSVTGDSTQELGLLKQAEIKLSKKPATRIEEFYRTEVQQEKRRLKQKLLKEDSLNSYERYKQLSKNTLEDSLHTKVEADLSQYDKEGQKIVTEKLNRLDPNISLIAAKGKLKPEAVSIEAYNASKKIYQQAERQLTSEDVYFHTRDAEGKDYIGYGISDDYLRLAVGQELADSFTNIKSLNKLLSEERQIADMSGDYSILEALENRKKRRELTKEQAYQYDKIINKVQSSGYQKELNQFENIISQDKYRGTDTNRPTRADKYFKYKEKTLNYLEKQQQVKAFDTEKLWIERLFNFYEGAARFTGYVERAGSPTGGSLVSQLRNVYSIDVLKEREKAEGYAFTTADGYNNTSLIMSAYSSYSVQGGDWDGDSYSLVKGYDTMLQDVLSSIEDRNKIKAAVSLFKSEDNAIGLTEDRQLEYENLKIKQTQVEQEIENKLALVEAQKDKLHGSSLYQQAREGMRRHAASVSGLPLEVLMDNRMFDDAKISNTLEHHRNILGNLAFAEAGEVSSMVRIFSEAYDNKAQDKISTLYSNLDKLRGTYGNDIINDFQLHLSQVDQSKLQDKNEAFNAFAAQIQDFYQTKASLDNLNDFVGSASGQVLDLKTFETSQNIIGYLGTSLIGEGYNSLIGLLPKAAIARSLATEFGSKTSSLGLDGEEVNPSKVSDYANVLGKNLISMGRADLADEFINIDKLKANASRASARANSLTGSLALIQQILRDSLKPKGDGGLLDILERVDKETGNTFVVDYLNTPDELNERGVNQRVQKLRTFISTEEVQKRLTPKESASLNIFGSIYLLSDYMKFQGRFNPETTTYDPKIDIESKLASEEYKEYDIVRERMSYYKNLIENPDVVKSGDDYSSNGFLNMAKVSGLEQDSEFREKMAYDADFAYRQTVADMLNVATVEERLGKYIGLETPKSNSDKVTFETNKVNAVAQVDNIRNVFIRALAGDALTEEEIKEKASGLDYIEATKDLLNTDKAYQQSIKSIFNIRDEDIKAYTRDSYVAPVREFVTEKEYAQSFNTLKNMAYLQQSMHGISAEDLTYLRTNSMAGMEIKNASYSLMDTFDPFIKATSESQRGMLDLLQRGKLDTPESFKSASERYLMSSSEAMIKVSNKLRNKYMTEGGQIDLTSFRDSDLYQAASWIGQFTGTFEGGAYSSKKFSRDDYEAMIVASLTKDESGSNLIEKAAYKNAGMAALGQTNALLSTLSERIQSTERYIQENASLDSESLSNAQQQLKALQQQRLEYSNSLEQYREAIKKHGSNALESIGQEYLNKNIKDQPDLIEETRRIIEQNQKGIERSKTTAAASLLIAPFVASMIDGGVTVNDRVVQMGYDLTESVFSYQAANAVGNNARYARMADKAMAANRLRNQIVNSNSIALGSIAAASGEMLISGAARAVADFIPRSSKGGLVGGLLTAATEVATTAAAISASRVLGNNEYGAYDQEYQDYTQQALMDMASGVYEATEAYFEAMFEDNEVYGATEDQNIDFEVSEEDESEFEQRINLGWIEVSFVDEEGNPLEADEQEAIFEDQGSW